MSETTINALLILTGVVLTAIGGVVGALIAARSAANTSKETAEQLMIDQLQEELAGYRRSTDERLDRLERENRAYRAFIFVQRDHMVDNGVKPPPWPDDIPR